MVDHQQTDLTGHPIRVSQRFQYAEAGSPQLRRDPLLPAGGYHRIVVGREFCEKPCQPLQRLVARTHFLPQPVASARAFCLGIEQRQEPGTNQRGLSAARAADHRDKAEAVNQPVERKGLVFAAEEEFMILIGKGPQTGKRMLRRSSQQIRRGVHETLARAAGTSWSSRSAVGMLLLDRSTTKSISPRGNRSLLAFLRWPGGGAAITAR